MSNDAEYNNLEKFMKKTLGKMHIKRLLYGSILLPGEEMALHKLRKMASKSSTPVLKDDGKKIVFNTLNARHMMVTYIDSMLAKALQMRGHDVKMILCGRFLNMCTGHHDIDTPYENWSCKNCYKFSKKFYDVIGLPYSTYWHYFLQNKYTEEAVKKIIEMSPEECETFQYKGIDVGYHATTSAQRYFKGDIPDKKAYNKILKLELSNAVATVDVAENVVKKEKPDIFATSHGCYSAWGSFIDYCKSKGITTRCYMPGETETIMLDPNRSDEYYDGYLSKRPGNLSVPEKKELDEFIKRRTAGTEGQTTLYGFENVEKEKIENKFKFKEYKKTFALFPNVPWDAALVGADATFKDLFDWMSTTINKLNEHKELQLIIKIHPSEVVVMESKKTIMDYLSEKHERMGPNIYVIPPKTEIAPYSLFPYIDIGLVYNGTVGLEMAMQNIPVIVAGNAHYGKKEFTYDITSKEQYMKMLLDGVKPLDGQMDKADKYAYFYFIKTYVPNQYLYAKTMLKVGWDIKSFDDFGEGKNKYLDHICNYIINGGIYQDWDK